MQLKILVGTEPARYTDLNNNYEVLETAILNRNSKIIIGHTSAGDTENTCDFLCDDEPSNNATVIQAALDAITNSNNILRFRKARYLLDRVVTLSNKPGVIVEGNNATIELTDNNNMADSAVFKIQSSDNIEINRLIVSINNPTTDFNTNCLLAVQSNNVTIDGCTLTNATMSGFQSQNGNNITVKNSTFNNNGEGITIKGVSQSIDNISVLNNKVTNSKFRGIGVFIEGRQPNQFATNVFIGARNIVDTSAYNIPFMYSMGGADFQFYGVGIYGKYVSKATITNNNVTGNNFHAIGFIDAGSLDISHNYTEVSDQPATGARASISVFGTATSPSEKDNKTISNNIIADTPSPFSIAIQVTSSVGDTGIFTPDSAVLVTGNIVPFGTSIIIPVRSRIVKINNIGDDIGI